MDSYLKKSISLLVIVLCLQLFSLFGIITRGNKDFIYNILGATLFWLIFKIIEWTKNLKVPIYVQGVAALAIVSDGLCGYYLNLYTLSALFDRVQHVFATYALTLFFYSAITYTCGTMIQSRLLRFFFVVALGLSLGTLYEIIEFLSDTLTNPQIPNQPGLEDTDLDLISDLIGALMAGIHSLFSHFCVSIPQQKTKR